MNSLIKIIISLFSFLAIVLMPVFLIIWQYEFFFPKAENIEFKNYQEKVMGHLINKDELPSEMTSLEVSHMNDVKNLVVYTNLFLLVAILVLIFLYIYLKRKNNIKLFYQSLKISSSSILVLIFILFALLVFNFDSFFNNFHEIFFPQGNWLFPISSKMIQAFPETLFKNLAFYSLGISSLLALFILIINKNKKI